MADRQINLDKCGCGRYTWGKGEYCDLCHDAIKHHRTIEGGAFIRLTPKERICPACGAKLVRRRGMDGWWQCAAYSTNHSRVRGYKHWAACSFQVFAH